jgi:transcriptional regulator with XRE-family HTH domain
MMRSEGPAGDGEPPERPRRRRGAARGSRRRGPTIEDVAAIAGVSRGTVSRALNGGHYVSSASLAAVNRAILEIGYLVNRGCRRIATITGPLDTPGGLERLGGYRDVVGRRAGRRRIANGDYTRRGGEVAMNELLERNPDLDAVFVAPDLMAAGALAALRRAGRRVPRGRGRGRLRRLPRGRLQRPAAHHHPPASGARRRRDGPAAA